jgi:hypothetical protein
LIHRHATSDEDNERSGETYHLARVQRSSAVCRLFRGSSFPIGGWSVSFRTVERLDTARHVVITYAPVQH